MLYLLVYLGIGFLSAMVLEWTGRLNGIFDDIKNVSMRSKVIGKAIVHLVLSVYWPMMLTYYISLKVDSKKGRA